MRFIVAGLLILFVATAADAQVKGQILDVGFNNAIRPDCWIPMHVQLTATSSEQAEYQIQIAQEDLDRDQVIYPQHISLGGVVEGHAAPTEEFWVYFRPTPTNGGLPDANEGATVGETNKALKVFLCTKDGKQISIIPNTATLSNIDPRRSEGDDSPSRKMILVVTDGTDRPDIPFRPENKPRGVLEEADVEIVHPSDLPSNVIGYDAVDAVVWMDADANYLASGTRAPTLEALRQYVRLGGHLIVCQPPEPGKVKPFADMLPVASSIADDWKIDIIDCKDEPSRFGQGPFDILRNLSEDYDPEDGKDHRWKTIPGSFRVARAVPTADAKVVDWIVWPGEKATFHTPWLARRSVGLGAVTWVAQDLGSEAITGHAKTGWQFVWNHVFDWNNPAIVKRATEKVDDWRPAGAIDLGAPLLKGMDLANEATFMVSLAFLFFVGYWLIAGPGVYFYLVAKKRSQFSWFYFALSAVVATALTVLVVKLVVRGPPKLRHVSTIRYAAGSEYGTIRSRFGLYIKQDGPQKIEVKDPGEHEVSYIAPFAINPQFVSSDDTFPAYLQYQIPVRDASDSAALDVSIPYRSTSKKLEVEWVGDLKNKVEIKPGTTLKLSPEQHLIDGTLVNNSGSDLVDVYIAFKSPVNGDVQSIAESDWLAYYPQWSNGAELPLDKLFDRANMMNLSDSTKQKPLGSGPSYGRIKFLETGNDWYTFLGQELGERVKDPASQNVYLAMLTLFDRMPPWKLQTNPDRARFEFYRRNARYLNLSPAESAGSLVMVAVEATDNFRDTGNSPLPIGLNVSDSPVTGNGTTMVQFVFPIDRSKVYGHPATMPTTQPEK